MKTKRTAAWCVALVIVATSAVAAPALELPMRQTPIPETTNGVPHVQIGVKPNTKISDQLVKRVAEIPGIRIRPTVISLPGALGFWINKDVPLARPEAIVGGREFAHIHPDGSLHASLSPELAVLAVKAGWGVAHPWANRRPGWEGFVMIFTPANSEELEVVYNLVEQSFSYVTGANISSN